MDLILQDWSIFMPRNLSNWIQAYLAYTNESESPEIFHRWVALSIIAGALRRSVWFEMDYFRYYPNLYVVLVSPPGRCKKSTAMRIGKGYLMQVPVVKFGVDSTSRERLITDLSSSMVDGQSSMTSHSSEFATMLATSGMDMVVFLTDIYDSPEEWTHRTKSGGTSKIKSPCFNFMAGTTPDWISRAMPLDTVGIGLTSRILFIYSDEPRIRDPFPELSKAQHQLKELLIADLTTISTIQGQYILNPEAKAYYRHWHRNTRLEESNIAESRLSGYHERKPSHLLKVAMVMTAGISDDLVIQQDTLIDALAFLKEIEDPMKRVFSSVGRNPLASDYEQVRDYIVDNDDGVKKNQLLDRFKHNMRREELDEVVDTLIAIGEIIMIAGGVYKKAV